jgi:O-antigen/teichoic acid export membrane protein
MKVQGASLRKDMGWAVIGEAGYLASQFAMLMALAWFGELADVGRFGFASAVTLTISMFAYLGLRPVLATDVAGEFDPVEYFRLRMICSLLSYPVMLIASLGIAPDAPTIAMIAVIGVAKLVEAQSDIYYGVFQKNNRMDIVARSLLFRGPVVAVPFALLMWQTGEPLVAFVSQIVCWSVVVLLHDRPVAVQLCGAKPLPWDTGRMISLARHSLPAGFVNLLNSLASNAPRLVVGWILGLQALGLYTAVAYVYQAGTVSAVQASNSLAAPLARAYREGQAARFYRLIRRPSWLFAGISIAGAVVAYFIGEDVLGLVLGEEYREAGFLLALIFAALGLQSVVAFFQMAAFAQRQLKPLAMLRGALVPVALLSMVVGTILGGLDGAG